MTRPVHCCLQGRAFIGRHFIPCFSLTSSASTGTCPILNIMYIESLFYALDVKHNFPRSLHSIWKRKWQNFQGYSFNLETKNKVNEVRFSVSQWVHRKQCCNSFILFFFKKDESMCLRRKEALIAIGKCLMPLLLHQSRAEPGKRASC